MKHFHIAEGRGGRKAGNGREERKEGKGKEEVREQGRKTANVAVLDRNWILFWRVFRVHHQV